MAENNDALYVGKYFDVKKYVSENKDYELVTLHLEGLEGFVNDIARTVKVELVDYVQNVREYQIKNVCLDARSANYADSSGLATILTYNRINRNLGANHLNLICTENGSIERLMLSSGMDTFLNVCNDLSEL
jgi:hypothetical protein